MTSVMVIIQPMAKQFFCRLNVLSCVTEYFNGNFLYFPHLTNEAGAGILL